LEEAAHGCGGGEGGHGGGGRTAEVEGLREGVFWGKRRWEEEEPVLIVRGGATVGLWAVSERSPSSFFLCRGVHSCKGRVCFITFIYQL
jgi:hypothetical protein